VALSGLGRYLMFEYFTKLIFLLISNFVTSFQMAFFKSLKNELVQFCSKTSIQGMSNVVDTQQGIFFRFLWFLVVITSIICAGICLKENVSGN
jgi:hypothetical protein